ncbi:MAG: transketolase [Eubacteriales bacterium]|nr:transketolase [Eubacteriales bacterium]MDY3333064.1 transketolase [Gallibacter sp.]
MNSSELALYAKNVRKTILSSIHEAGSGHPGGSLSMADILTVLYFNHINIDPANPMMEDRDKFVLSKGHGAPGLYSILAEKGFFEKEDVLSLRKINGRFQGHPCMSKLPGIEMSTGSLGQGFSASVGMALANKIDEKKSKVYVILGDGELQEGIVWEAAMAAAHYGLSNLIAIVDWNGLQIDGKNDDVMRVTPIDEKFAAFGWNVLIIDGHNLQEIDDAISTAKEKSNAPTVIIAKTHKGKGVSFMEDNAGWHGKAPNDEEFAIAMKELGE